MRWRHLVMLILTGKAPYLCCGLDDNNPECETRDLPASCSYSVQTFYWQADLMHKIRLHSQLA